VLAREVRGETTERLDGGLRAVVAAGRAIESVRFVLLRRIDSDQANGCRTARQPHPDRVTVDDVENGHPEG